MSHDQVDVVVVGAGAAGLAAARTAMALGLSVRVLEAKDRIGGRAFTDEIVPGVPWDRGAHWLHDARHNFYAAYGAEIGFAFDEVPRHFYLRGPDGRLDEAVIREREAYFDEAFAAIDRAGAAGLDVAASEVVPPHPRFQAMFESWYAAVSGAEPAHSSTLDDSRYRNGGNRRVRPGYGALVAAYGKGLPVALSTPARRIRWGGTDVVVDTATGALSCRAAIVTVSTSALIRDALTFDPPLPDATRAALDAVPLGSAEKVAFAFARDIFGLPENSHVHFLHDTLEALRFHIRPSGHLTAIGYLAGGFAAELEAAGTGAMVDFAERKLVEVFGSDVRRACVATATTHWTSDPWIRGGYSYAQPGAADQRLVLREPIGERIFLAGEACSLTGFGTVHGAHESGVEAARLVQARLPASVSTLRGSA